MELRKISSRLTVSTQGLVEDMVAVKRVGFRAIICNRPDGEATYQPSVAETEAGAKAAGLEARYAPVQSGMVKGDDVVAFIAARQNLPPPVLAYCRTGIRSVAPRSFHQVKKRPISEILAATKAASHEMNGVARSIANGGKTHAPTGDAKYGVVIVGGGAGGISAAARLKSRNSSLDFAVIDTADIHCYQPGCTMVGGAVHKPSLPAWVRDGVISSRAASFLTEKLLPPVYWWAMLKGKEWMARPEQLKVAAEQGA